MHLQKSVQLLGCISVRSAAEFFSNRDESPFVVPQKHDRKTIAALFFYMNESRRYKDPQKSHARAKKLCAGVRLAGQKGPVLLRGQALFILPFFGILANYLRGLRMLACFNVLGSGSPAKSPKIPLFERKIPLLPKNIRMHILLSICLIHLHTPTQG